MHAATTNPQILANLAALVAEPPRSVAERIADVYVEDAEAGHVTLKDDLIRLGFSAEEIEAHAANASVIASARLQPRQGRDIDTAPTKSLADVERDIVDVILDHLPDAQLLIADCQARGISKRHLDLLFAKARARAALTFCNAKTEGAH